MEEKEYWSEKQIAEYLRRLEEYNNQKELNVDMHNHTTGSDGNDSPLMLLLRAHRLDLDTIAITDHNTVNGYNILKEQLEKIIVNLEELNKRTDLTQDEKTKMLTSAKRLFKILEKMKIVTGCEVLTVYKGCPYVEILAYGVDLDVLDEKLKQAREGLDSPGETLYKGLKDVIQKHAVKIDDFFLEHRSDYRKMFYHELIRHPENAYLYENIQGETEEQKAENFAKLYLDNPESDFYVDLNNAKTRKLEMQKMIKRHENLTFDIDIIKNAGSAAGQFYTELLKYPENKDLIDPSMDSLKKFIYLGLYNENSPFFVDLSKTKPSPETVINAIHEAEGKALVAHWGRYMLSNKDVFDWQTEQGRKNLEEIIDMCDGAECAYPDNSIELRRTIYNMCKEKGKFISIGGDNHGSSGKEGKQYQLGSQFGRDVKGLEWIKESVVEGKEFIQQVDEEHQYKKRLKNIINNQDNNQQDGYEIGD